MQLIVVARPLNNIDDLNRIVLLIDCSEIVLSCEQLLHGWAILSKYKAGTLLEVRLKYSDVADILLEFDLVFGDLLTVFSTTFTSLPSSLMSPPTMAN